jgi:hypothetical protein
MDTQMFHALEKKGLLNPAWKNLPNWETLGMIAKEVLFMTAHISWDTNSPTNKDLDGRADIDRLFAKSFGSTQVKNCLRELKMIADQEMGEGTSTVRSATSDNGRVPLCAPEAAETSR